MTTSDAFTLEPGNNSMFNDYTALYNAVDSFDNPDHIELTKEYFQSSFSYPTVNLSRDIVLVRNANGELIASGTVFTQSESSHTSRLMIQVQPEYRRLGIGSRILEHMTEIGLKRGSSVFVCRFPNFRSQAVSFAEHHGFSLDYTWVKMRIEHEKPVKVTPLPWGLTVRELAVWAQLQNAIFKDYPGYEDVNSENMTSIVKHSSFDPNLLVIGTVFEKPIGYCLGLSVGSTTNDKTLKIEGMGVLPEHQRKGYGQALVFEILNRAYIKGHSSSELVVLSDNKAAIDLYKKCGFQERYHHLWYKKKLLSNEESNLPG